MIEIKKCKSVILKTLFFTIFLLFTTLINFYDFNNIGIGSSKILNLWNIILSLLGFIWGVNCLYKEKKDLGILFISITSIMIFENIILVILKAHC